MKKISLLLAVILTLMIVLAGCGANAGMENSGMANDMAYTGSGAPSATYAPKEEYDGVYESGSTTGSGSSGTGSVGSGIYGDTNNKVIRTANLTIQTTEFDASVEALNRLTEENGGYYETAEVTTGGYYNQYATRSAYYVVRIPRENFIAFRDGTGGIGHVYSISENSQDVGEVYYDTEARLETLIVKRDRLLSLLEKAEKMEDIIALESALADVNYEIDMYTSQLRKYDSLINFSTFIIRLDEVAVITEQPGVTESFGSRLMSSFKAGFRNFTEGLEDFAFWFARNLIGIAIFAAIVVVVIVFIVRGRRRRRARRNQAQ